jgi:hypothetical protein
MEKGKAFVLVGHSDWGKSRTLQRLISPKKYGWWEYKPGVGIFVKTMSNDDIVDSLVNFAKNTTPTIKKIIIIALCPDFENPEKKTEVILDILKEKYELSFFVLAGKYDQTAQVLPGEIESLKKYGTVRSLNKPMEDTERAKEFRALIDSVLVIPGK